ncbi:MAG TPA: hypothetical protein DES72_13250, partial [Gammaproteobacteria bacterium]|nr:hypothetical protein [Gammaproteobacteria bacterium]
MVGDAGLLVSPEFLFAAAQECNVLSSEKVCCPDYLLRKVRNLKPVKTAVVGTGAQVVLEGVRDAVEAGIIEPVLIGDPDVISAYADEIAWSTKDCEIVAAVDEIA